MTHYCLGFDLAAPFASWSEAHFFVAIAKSLGWRYGVWTLQGHSLSAGLDDVQRAEMKAYMELVNNMLLTAEVYIQIHTYVTHI